jgi:hypothetical protein
VCAFVHTDRQPIDEFATQPSGDQRQGAAGEREDERDR